MSTASSFGYNEDNTMDTKELILNGEKNSVKNGTTVFKSVGMSILDILTAKLIYEKLNN